MTTPAIPSTRVLWELCPHGEAPTHRYYDQRFGDWQWCQGGNRVFMQNMLHQRTALALSAVVSFFNGMPTPIPTELWVEVPNG